MNGKTVATRSIGHPGPSGIVDCLHPHRQRDEEGRYPRPFGWLGIPRWAIVVIVVAVLIDVVRALLRR